MTDITVTATKNVIGIYVEMPHTRSGNIQGTIQTLLTAPPESGFVIGETTTPATVTVRKMGQTTRAVLDAVEVLRQAVLVWEQEDIAAAAAPPEVVP